MIKENKIMNNKLEVGDVLNETWGYEQTNQNFYQVTKKIGKTMVELVEVASKIVETKEYGEYVTFDKDNFLSHKFKRKVKIMNWSGGNEKPYVNLRSFSIATLTNESEKHWVTGWAYGH